MKKYIVAFGDGKRTEIMVFAFEKNRRHFIKVLKAANFSYCTAQADEK
jgi:hypothetical protein